MSPTDATDLLGCAFAMGACVGFAILAARWMRL